MLIGFLDRFTNNCLSFAPIIAVRSVGNRIASMVSDAVGELFARFSPYQSEHSVTEKHDVSQVKSENPADRQGILGGPFCEEDSFSELDLLASSDDDEAVYSIETEIVSLKKSSEELPKLGVLWDCIEEKPNLAGGKLLAFKLNPRFTQFSLDIGAVTQIRELFPAEEPLSFQEAKEILGISRYHNSLKRFQFLQRLGYDIRSDEEIIILPDHEALMANWRQLQGESRQNTLELPHLIILSSEGIADDCEFVEAYLTHGALLSAEKEFVHDHFFHLIPQLLGMGRPDWAQHRADAVKLVENAEEKVIRAQEQLKNQRGDSSEINKKIDLRIQQLDTVLGMFTDILAARELPLANDSLDLEAFRDIGLFFELQLSGRRSGRQWRDFWARRGYPYPSEEDIIEITKLLKGTPST
ncbi:MAG: hypothetical protein Q8L98_07955 [Chlamydiales bacterium]|nr:hypothetical protein [Chlamydiales bacterium]